MLPMCNTLTEFGMAPGAKFVQRSIRASLEVVCEQFEWILCQLCC